MLSNLALTIVPLKIQKIYLDLRIDLSSFGVVLLAKRGDRSKQLSLKLAAQAAVFV